MGGGVTAVTQGEERRADAVILTAIQLELDAVQTTAATTTSRSTRRACRRSASCGSCANT